MVLSSPTIDSPDPAVCRSCYLTIFLSGVPTDVPLFVLPPSSCGAFFWCSFPCLLPPIPLNSQFLLQSGSRPPQYESAECLASALQIHNSSSSNNTDWFPLFQWLYCCSKDIEPSALTSLFVRITRIQQITHPCAGNWRNAQTFKKISVKTTVSVFFSVNSMDNHKKKYTA